MLPSLPAFVEDLNLGDCQFEIVGESDQQDEEQLFNTTMEEMQKLLFTTDSANSDIQYLSVPPGLVFNNLETDEIQQRKSISSSVIPLYVQQEQLDNIDAQTATLSSYWMDDIQPMSSLTASTNAFQLQMPAEYQTSPEATDQTVPFRRRENVCSMVSSCSEVKEVKRERECSVSESSELLAPSSSLLPTALFTPPPTSQVFNHIGRRGRPCLNDLNGDAAKDKKLRRREQNRRAATKCRHKRRAEFEQLKKDHEEVMRRNSELKDELEKYVSQYERLQVQLSLHQQHCGLTLPSTWPTTL